MFTHFNKTSADDIEELEKANLQLKKYSNELFEAFEEEKHKLARELHDTIGQNLLSIRVKLQKHRELFSYYNSTAEYQDMMDLLEQSFRQIKLISYSLKPGILDEMGLGPALNSFCRSISEETGIKASIDIFESTNLPDQKLEAHLYRIVQETLYNRLCNSDLSEFNLQVIDSKDKIKIFFADNGKAIGSKEYNMKGFRTYCVPLEFIKEKVESMEGTMKINFSSESGVVIIVNIPKKES